jgi:hypothetical protein
MLDHQDCQNPAPASLNKDPAPVSYDCKDPAPATYDYKDPAPAPYD